MSETTGSFAHAVAAGDEAVVRRLVARQRSIVNVPDRDRNAPLHVAASSANAKLCEFLLESGADVNAQNNAGLTPIHVVCQVGDKASLRHMLNRPDSFSSVNAQTYLDKVTPLHLAATAISNDSLAMCQMLLKKGAVLTFRDTQGNTPLLRAIQSRNYETFKFLVEQSADVFAINKMGLTALHHAAKSGSMEASQLCGFRQDLHARVNKVIRVTPLHLAASGGHVEICKYLISKGTPVDIKTIHGATPLHLAAGSGQRDVVVCLLQAGANVEARDEKDRTPLFRAVLCGSLPSVIALIEANAEPSPSRDGLYIPLHYACMRKDSIILAALASHPAVKINEKDASHHTALHWAALEGDRDCVSILLGHGIDMSAKDVENNTAAAVAGLRGNDAIAELLHARAGSTYTKPVKRSGECLNSFWISDKDAPNCRRCSAKFTVFIRKHHCRYCRKIFCNACTSKRLAPPHDFANIRLCDKCHHDLSPLSSNTIPTNPFASHMPKEQGEQGREQGREPAHPPHQEEEPEEPEPPQEHISPVLEEQPFSTAAEAQEHMQYLEQEIRRWQELMLRELENDNRLFQQQFEILCGVGVEHTSDVCDAHSEDNRYSDIVAYDHTLVRLGKTGPAEYINANVLEGYGNARAFIATQGPLPSTIVAFWQMVWEQQARVIVMVTSEVENGRVKCARYWPTDTRNPIVAVPFRVKFLSIENHDGFVVRRLQLSGSKAQGTRIIHHFMFSEWPDHGAPSSPAIFLRFVRHVKACSKGAPALAPVVVHCSAGVGRSGTFIATDWLIELVAKKESLNIFEIVRRMRESRNYMVQTLDQYLFIHTALLNILFDRRALFQAICSPNDPPAPPREEMTNHRLERDDDTQSRPREGSSSSASSDGSFTRRNSVPANPKKWSRPPSRSERSPSRTDVPPTAGNLSSSAEQVGPDWNPFWGEREAAGDAPSLSQAADRIVEEAQQRLRKARQNNASGIDAASSVPASLHKTY